MYEGYPDHRPPFPPGHTLSLKHGAESDRVIEAKAAVVRQTLLDVAPWLAEPEYAPAVARFLRAEARALLLHENIAKISTEKGTDKVPVRQWEQATAADRLAAQLGNVLGLDPLGKAKLQALATSTEVQMQSLADLAAEGRTILDARRARAAADSPQEPLEAGEATPTSPEPADGNVGGAL